MSLAAPEVSPTTIVPDAHTDIAVVFSGADRNSVFIHFGAQPKRYDLEEFALSLEHNEVLQGGKVLLKYHGDTGIERIMLTDRQFGYIDAAVQRQLAKQVQPAAIPDNTIPDSARVRSSSGVVFSFFQRMFGS